MTSRSAASPHSSPQETMVRSKELEPISPGDFGPEPPSQAADRSTLINSSCKFNGFSGTLNFKISSRLGSGTVVRRARFGNRGLASQYLQMLRGRTLEVRHSYGLGDKQFLPTPCTRGVLRHHECLARMPVRSPLWLDGSGVKKVELGRPGRLRMP